MVVANRNLAILYYATAVNLAVSLCSYSNMGIAMRIFCIKFELRSFKVVRAEFNDKLQYI